LRDDVTPEAVSIKQKRKFVMGITFCDQGLCDSSQRGSVFTGDDLMSIPRSIACMLGLALAAGTVTAIPQAQASTCTRCCEMGGPLPPRLQFAGLGHKFGKPAAHRLKLRNAYDRRKHQEYMEAGKPGPDSIIFRIAPYDMDLA
jgi:hypothetical protein